MQISMRGLFSRKFFSYFLTMKKVRTEKSFNRISNHIDVIRIVALPCSLSFGLGTLNNLVYVISVSNNRVWLTNGATNILF